MNLGELVVQLGRFDDDAWVALANRGLLRRARKDLTTLTPELVADGNDAVEIRVGDVVVRFDERGPAGAVCECPSGSVCQHIIAAGLWLLSTTEQPSQASGDGPEVELLTADVELLTSYAGRTGYRWALRYVDDLDLESDVRVEVGKQFIVALSSPRVTFRSMGGGVAGLVPDTRLAALEKYQVAAVLAYQRLCGVGPPPADVPETSTPTHVADSRARLRVAIAQLLTDTVRLGVAHLSGSVQQRYETLAVWAQGAQYHRLARVLRRLADHVELLLDRSARADEHRLLEEAAVAYALVCALDVAGDTRRLMGQARNQYDVVRRLEVIGLGAFPWRAASGYHGLTALFWWPQEQRFLSWTDARPELLRGFDPRARYRSGGPWSGLDSPAATIGAEVRLSDARLDPSGRLSGVERTRATAVQVDGAAIAAAVPTVSRWAELKNRPQRSLLDRPDPLGDWAVLRPAAFGRPSFDPVRQSLRWEVTDDEGEQLTLLLPYTAENRPAIERIEGHGDQVLPTGTLLVARLYSTATGLVGEPMSLVRPDLAAGFAVDPLHFGPSTKAVAATPAVTRTPATPRLPAAPARLPAALEELQHWLVRQAERGTGAACAGALSAELASRHRAVRDIGFVVFPLSAGEDPAIGILRSRYLLLQTAQLLAGHTG